MSTVVAVSLDTPSDAMTDDQLAAFVKGRFAKSTQANDEMIVLGRRSIAAYYEAGWALSIVQTRTKATGNWQKWKNSHELPDSTVGYAIDFYRKAEKMGVDEISKLPSLAEAKRFLGLADESGKRTNRSGRTRTATPHKLHVLRFPLKTWQAAINAISDVVYTVENDPKTIAFGKDLKEARKLVDALQKQVDKIKDSIDEAAKIAPAMKAESEAAKSLVASDGTGGGGRAAFKPKPKRKAA